MEKKEIVIVPVPSMGHLVPMIELAKRLIQRDNSLSVTVIIFKEPLLPNFGSYVDSLSSSIPEIRFIEIPPQDNQAPERLSSRLLENCKPRVKHTITQLIISESIQLSALIIDFFFSNIVDVGTELGVPTFLFFVSCIGTLGLMLQLPTLDAQITTEFKELQTDLIIPSLVNPVPPNVLPSPLLNRRDDEDAYKWFISHGDRARETKGIIVNTFVDLESTALKLLTGGRIPPVYTVGPLIELQSNTPTQLLSDRTQHEKIMKWLDEQPPSSVVLLCFGSMGTFSAAQVKETAVALERSGYRFLWSLREPRKPNLSLLNDDLRSLEGLLPDGFLDRTEGRGLVCGWVSQVEVLSHRAIGGFVSHCGWNSVLESFWFNVPILTWPLYGDQQIIAFEMARELGLVVEMRLDTRMGRGAVEAVVMAEEVERGVRCLMDGDNEVRKKVKGVSTNSRKAVMEGGSSFESLGHLIEDMIKKNT